MLPLSPNNIKVSPAFFVILHNLFSPLFFPSSVLNFFLLLLLFLATTSATRGAELNSSKKIRGQEFLRRISFLEETVFVLNY